MRTIAIANQKGGTGKTTTAVNLAASLAERGKRVLLVDLDPQGNASTYLGHPDDGRSMLGVFTGDATLESITVATDCGVHLAPAGEWLAGAEKALAGEVGPELVFREAVERLPKTFDFVIVDCPPSLGILSISALVGCQEVLVPVLTEAMPLEGVANFYRTIQRVKTRLNPSLKIAGVLSCKTDQTKLSRGVEQAMRGSLGEQVFRTVVRKNVRVAESYSHKQPVSSYAPGCPGTQDYQALATELLEGAA